MTVIRNKVTVFEAIENLYANDEDFSRFWNSSCKVGKTSQFRKHNGYLFFENRLCIPRGSLRTQLIFETHGEGLSEP